MRARSVLLLLLVGLVFAPGQASAYRFGTDESFRKIEDVKLKGTQDEALFLGHMVRTPNFLLGVYVEDAGYVLGVQGNSKQFYKMPQGDELAGFQRNGFLPNPLPPYRLNAFDYIFGYSLWWGLALTAAILWWSSRRKRAGDALPTGDATPSPASPTAPAGALSPMIGPTQPGPSSGVPPTTT